MQNQITEWGTALMTSLSAAMALLFQAIPKLIGFAVILIVGWLIAAVLAKAIMVLLRAVKFNDLAHSSGMAAFVHNMGVPMDTVGVVGAIVRWFVRLIALVVAFDALGLPAVSEVLRQVLLWLPNVVVAVVILVIAGLAANALGKLVRGTAAESGLRKADLLGRVASGLVIGFGIIVAISQLGIATVFVDALFVALVGAVALAVGLAFGLGARETAAQIIREWYGSRRVQRGVRTAEGIGEAMGEAIRPTSLNEERRLRERRAGA
jgi:hypothetical protein